MGKTKDLFKKIRDTKGTFHAKMGLIKDRNGMDLTEAEDIEKRWQEYTEELYKKDLHDPDNHDGVITDLVPDILKCEVKWALESITINKASGGDGIPVDLFQNGLVGSPCCPRDSQESSTTPQFKSISSKALSAKMGSIKDRNGMDLAEPEDIEKRWQEYTEELYKKDLHDPDNHDGVTTHLEPNIRNVQSSGL